MTPFPAAWMNDPTRRHQLRYWDGIQWTAHISNNGVPGSDPLTAPAPMSVMPAPSDAALPGPAPFAPPGYTQMPVYAQGQMYGQSHAYGQRMWREDNGFTHFLRFLMIWIVMAASFYLIVGFVWLAFALAATGRRKRDLLMIVLPVWSIILFTETLWRYTAKNVYWSVRSDVISKSLFSG